MQRIQIIRILIGFGVAVVLHLLLGWAWTMGGGIVAGLYRAHRAWIAGGIAVGLGWAVFVLHALAVAPEPSLRLFNIMGALFGNIPSAFVPVGTVLVGILLGMAGGGLGGSILTCREAILRGKNQQATFATDHSDLSASPVASP